MCGIAGIVHWGTRPDAADLARVRTIEQLIGLSVADRRFVLSLVGVFGLAALALAVLGIYSVISYLVTQRSRELSIRVALGAQGRDVVGLVLRQGVVLALVGIVVGAGNSAVDVGQADISGDDAFVEVAMIYNPSDPFSTGYRDVQNAILVRQGGAWKLSSMPTYYLWDYNWYQEPPK